MGYVMYGATERYHYGVPLLWPLFYEYHMGPFAVWPEFDYLDGSTGSMLATFSVSN
jgi:hypothetical protein